MKTIQTTINGVPVLLVQLPEDACKFTMMYSTLYYFINWVKVPGRDPIKSKESIRTPEPPTGYTWRFVNLTKDLTEEQAAGLVESKAIMSYEPRGRGEIEEKVYMDYLKGLAYFENSGDTYFTALESFESFLQANEVIDRVYHDKPNIDKYRFEHDYINDLDIWETQQSKVSTWGLIVGEKVKYICRLDEMQCTETCHGRADLTSKCPNVTINKQ